MPGPDGLDPLTDLDTMTSNALIAPVDGSAGEAEIQSPPTITEQEIGEFREQDRVLPVCYFSTCV
jgi:hypothetical protein